MTRGRDDASGLREAVAALWCAVLGVEEVGAPDDFFLEGGDSALAVETAVALRALSGTELGLDILYKYPKFGQLLDVLTEPRPVSGQRPLAPAEERLWVAERLHPGSPQYHIVALYQFAGSIDVPRLRNALDVLVARHAALRRGFESPGRAFTATRASVSCRWLDGRDVPASSLREVIDENARRPFDLANPPLLRALVVDRGDEGDLLLLTVHHLVCDGGSLAILEDDLSRLYSEGASGHTAGSVPQPEAHRAARPEGSSRLPDEEESRAYWRRVLAGCPRSMALPHDLPRPTVPDSVGGVHTFVCAQDMLADMARLAAEEGLSPFMTWVVAYTAGLAAVSGERDLVIGIAASSRAREQRGEIGMFVDPLPLRLLLPEGGTARELARRTRRATTEALAYRGMPLPALVEDPGPGGGPARMPPVQAGLSYLDVSSCALRFDGLEARRELLPTGTAKYELIWVVTRQAEHTIVELEYLSGLFSPERAADVHESIVRAARAAFARPDAALTVPEVVRDVPKPPVVLPPSDMIGRRPLPELVRLWAEQRPDAPAVRHREIELTYRELHGRAVSVAAGLRSAGLRRGSVVAVPMRRGIDSISAYLGILYAGCAYLPLDPDLPEDRVRCAVLGVADAALISGATPPPVPPQLPVLRMERLLADTCPEAARQAPVQVTGEDTAYLMSTSGSTGHPKTVVVPHRAISRLVPDAEGLAIHSGDRVAHVCNPAFDAATLEIWGALGAGALLVIGDKRDIMSPARLRAFLDKHRISVLGLPTALLNTVIDVAPDAFDEVRLLVFGGEKADEHRLARLMAHRPPARVVNVYGPTENTTVSTLQAVTLTALEPGPLPIGRCISGSTAYVLGPDGGPVVSGGEGELFVGGEGLAHGYHGNPSLTAASFLPDPFDPRGGGRLYRTGDRVKLLADGSLHFVGRTDDQVKVRGFRVELGEIEHVLRSMAAVTDAVALARATSDGAELVACVAGDGDEIDIAELDEELRRRLPDYMIPALIVKDHLPLNANGKVDRAALLASLPRDLPRPRSLGETAGALPADHAPVDPVAEAAAALWCESLGMEHVLPDDNFVVLGGHSIKALKLLARVEEKFGVAVDLADFLADPTLRRLVTAIGNVNGARMG